MKIGYARVSTHEQNLNSQIDSLEKFSCDKIISEKVTTKNEDRKKLKEIFGWLRSEDVLVCTKMDRLARSMKELSAIMDDLSQKNINVVFLDQKIDTAQAGGRLIFHIFAAFSEFERDLIRERTLAGLKSARARGKKGGRRKILSGTKLKTAFTMYDSRVHTVRQICDSLNIKERTFYEYLKRRKANDP
jgi:DNA invertase Pin-like site-specific DNA recombinase